MSNSKNMSQDSKPLTILHTSDWHLGRRLYGNMRYEEFQAFLDWLTQTIETNHVDVLIVAGDIFDTMTPSNKAQALYYEFLGKVSKLTCQHIVIVAGNHDSPTFLDAPANILKYLNVYVVGTACSNPEDEVLILEDKNGQPICIVAAVPYLRDRDVRASIAGESSQDKDANVISGIKNHYDAVAAIAKTKQAKLISTLNEQNPKCKHHIPIIATGHLFTAGGKTTDDDGVRDLYVGSLGKISADIFDPCFDYVALGHLHVPQKVGGFEHIRYSGSPIAMGFGEANQQKQVLLIQFSDGNIVNSVTETNNDFIDDLFCINDSDNADKTATNSDSKVLFTRADELMKITSLFVPCFQKLVQVAGGLTEIENTILSLPTDDSIWLEVVYTGDSIVSNLREQIREFIKETPFEVLKIKNSQIYNKVLKSESTSECLQDLNETEVFERCLTIHHIAESQKDNLRNAYQQILHDIYDDDKMAE